MRKSISRACLLPNSLSASELRSEVVDSMAFNGILLKEKIMNLAREVGRLLLRQKHLGVEEHSGENSKLDNLPFAVTRFI